MRSRLSFVISSFDHLIIEWAPSLIVTGLLLLVYGITLPPSLTWSHYGADGGDLATAVVLGRLPHPPGFPTYLLLGKLFILLPLGDPAWRLSFLSATMAAGAAGLMTRLFLLLFPPVEERRAVTFPAALVSGLVLGFSPLLWSQALIVEVYAPAAFFSVMVIWLLARDSPGWVVGLVWGMGMGLHPVLLFLAPLMLGSIVWTRSRPGGDSDVSAIFVVGLTAALGWGATAGPVVLAFGARLSPWGEVATIRGWWDFVSGRLYHGYLFALPPSAWPVRMVAGLGVLARQVTPVGVVLAAWGWNLLRQRQRAWAWGSVAALATFGLYALMYDTADSLVYLVPALPLAALWLGAGVARAAAWLRSRWKGAAWLLLLLPVLQAALFWGGTDLSDDVAAMAWAEEVLAEAPPGAVILTAEDAHTFTLWYARDVLRMRPDVLVLDVDLWGYRPYRRQMAAAIGQSDAPTGLSAEEVAHRSGRPVLEVRSERNAKTPYNT